MANNIINTAQISYNGTTLPPTCPVTTRVEPNIDAHKYATTDQGRFTGTGTIGESRKVTYDIILTNYSSKDFTDVVIKDVLTLPTGVAPEQVTYVTEESMFPNDTQIPNIEFNLGQLDAESQQVVHYTLQFADTVPVGSVIKNKANVNYTENTNLDDTGEPIPYETEEVVLTIDYSSTTVEAKKTGPENVLCGELFNYVLTFTNTGENEATEVTITDNLPDGFVVKSVSITNGGTILVRDRDYTYTDDASPLVIDSVDDGLNIASKAEVIVTINGKFECH